MKKNMHQLTLGELIDALKKCDPDNLVQFDFCDIVPTTIDSYRGYYEDLAIGYMVNGTAPTVVEFIAQLEACVGKECEGYKGGTYYMGRDTPLWVSNYGQSTGTAVVGLIEKYAVILVTASID